MINIQLFNTYLLYTILLIFNIYKKHIHSVAASNILYFPIGQFILRKAFAILMMYLKKFRYFGVERTKLNLITYKKYYVRITQNS